VSFAAITFCVTSQRVFIIVVFFAYFVIDSVRKLLDIPHKLRVMKRCLADGETRWNLNIQCFFPLRTF
jgi:hypothetical protein